MTFHRWARLGDGRFRADHLIKQFGTDAELAD